MLVGHSCAVSFLTCSVCVMCCNDASSCSIVLLRSQPSVTRRATVMRTCQTWLLPSTRLPLLMHRWLLSLRSLSPAASLLCGFIDTARIVCRTGSMHLSGVRLSVPPWDSVLQWPGWQEILINCCTAHSSAAGSATSSAYIVAERRFVLSEQINYSMLLLFCLHQ